MEISNETKIKVFAQYIGANCKVTNECYIDGGYIGIILGACTVRGLLVEHPKRSDADERIEDCQLILKSLSDIIDEDALWIRLKLENSFNEDVDIQDVINSIIDTHSCDLAGYTWLEIIQYLISKGYDLPQFLLDGKTLQEAGLAIYEKQ